MYIFGLIILLNISNVYSEDNVKFRGIPPRFKHIEKIFNEIGLTKEQKMKIKLILKSNKEDINKLNKQIIELRLKSIDLLKEYPLKKEKFIENQKAISELLKEIFIRRVKSYVEIIDVLNEDQYKRFVDFITQEIPPPPPD